jgi:hypothetical protein
VTDTLDRDLLESARLAGRVEARARIRETARLAEQAGRMDALPDALAALAAGAPVATMATVIASTPRRRAE